jgi:hypothetical protein
MPYCTQHDIDRGVGLLSSTVWQQTPRNGVQSVPAVLERVFEWVTEPADGTVATPLGPSSRYF